VGRRRRQVIPRPPSTRPGGPAPWASLPASARRAVSVEGVRRALQHFRPAPGLAEHAWPGETPAATPAAAPAAVLVPLFEEGGEARVVLTRRAAHLRTHTGEVSFPGGRLDAGETPEEGARREAAEEIGLDPSSVEVVGRLTPVATFSSGAVVTPVVGVLAGRPRLVANRSEVEHVFDVALGTLLADGVFREECWLVPELPGGAGAPGTDAEWRPMWFFELADDTIWGATARVLVELLRLACGL
jgi:8-oxo-dGTP pyrophosphatase MutT (NUDIX family)